ncbi:(2Fe-2S)-binding protein [Cecembia rubra]|uniref:Nicotinate dehydrogenase subunit A n=1 Tax=Cecembia rubra TaxID=1485585 RepID=A0A2P8E7S3_9BACT|nr:(2Fe-2S)-binding protein [Cecembia rubra]PSL05515.1 nicotinate dehydrogenase subunit A [Cecembia rubra]
MTKSIVLAVNGTKKTINVDPEEPLLYVLREEFGLNGPKFGCGLHQCGSCLVLANGQSSYTCRIPCSDFEGKKIETIEGLSKKGKLHSLQQSFFEVQAAQCGYCVNGMLISALELLRKNPNPNNHEIREALNKVICRCGTHSRFIKAVKKAADSQSKF